MHLSDLDTYVAAKGVIAVWHTICFCVRRKETKTMKTKTNCKAGTKNDIRLSANHSETLVRDNSKNLQVKTSLRAGKKAS